MSKGETVCFLRKTSRGELGTTVSGKIRQGKLVGGYVKWFSEKHMQSRRKEIL